jgi:hypothetical protein
VQYWPQACPGPVALSACRAFSIDCCYHANIKRFFMSAIPFAFLVQLTELTVSSAG